MDSQPKKKKLKKDEQKVSRTEESSVVDSDFLDQSAPTVPLIDSVMEAGGPPSPDASATDAPAKRIKKSKKKVAVVEPDQTTPDTVEVEPTKSKSKTATTRIRKTIKSNPVVTGDEEQPSPPLTYTQSSTPASLDQEETNKEKDPDNPSDNAQSAPMQSNDASKSTAKQKKAKKTESTGEEGTETAPVKAKTTRSKTKSKSEGLSMLTHCFILDH